MLLGVCSAAPKFGYYLEREYKNFANIMRMEEVGILQKFIVGWTWISERYRYWQ